MSEDPRCLKCRRLMATKEQWDSLPEGAGTHLCWGDTDDCRAALDKRLAALEHLAALAESFVNTASSALWHYHNRNAGGQQVPYHGDFASMGVPSVAKSLTVWRDLFEGVLEPLKEKTNG